MENSRATSSGSTTGLLDGARTRLRALKLNKCPIGDDALRHMPHMEHLSVTCALNRFRGTHIGAMTGLRRLEINDCRGLEDMRLNGCASLTELRVYHATDEHVRALTRLRKLEVASKNVTINNLQPGLVAS